MYKLGVALSVATITLVGCATMGTPYAPPPSAPQGKATVHFMRSSVSYGGAWSSVFSVNDVPAVSLYDKGYSYIYLDRGIYKFAVGTPLNKNYLKFEAPIDAGRDYFVEYNQEPTGYKTYRDKTRTRRGRQ